MTKKDYVAVAALLKAQLDGQLNTQTTPGYWVAHRDGYVNAITNIAKDLCETFKRDNPNFSKAKFLAACGLTTEGNGKVIVKEELHG